MKEEIILIGGGGHCKACIDVIETEEKFKIAGIVDIKKKLHHKVLGYEIIACDEDLPRLVKEYKNYLITMGQIKSKEKRKAKFECLKRLGAYLPTIISPSAHISKHALIEEGTIVLHMASINTNARIGKNCIINTGAVIEHDVTIGNHCHISTASIINGGCHVEEGVFVGSNSVVANKLNIAKNTIIGAGSLVIKSIKESGTYAGHPAKTLG